MKCHLKQITIRSVIYQEHDYNTLSTLTTGKYVQIYNILTTSIIFMCDTKKYSRDSGVLIGLLNR